MTDWKLVSWCFTALSAQIGYISDWLERS